MKNNKDVDSLSHTTWRCQYHVVFAPKYRRMVIYGQIKKDIGQVVNYFNKVKVAELKIWDDLAIGDEILIQGKTTGSIKHKIDSMQINGENVENVEKGNNVGVAIPTKVREHDFVYKLVKR